MIVDKFVVVSILLEFTVPSLRSEVVNQMFDKISLFDSIVIVVD